MGYGSDELYTRWSLRSLKAWKALEQRVGFKLFHQAGMLWLSGKDDTYARQVMHTLEHLRIDHRRLSTRELEERFPQISPDGIARAVWEPGSGALMARQSVQALVAECVREGVEYRSGAVVAPGSARGRLGRVSTQSGESMSAGAFVFACGAWLPKLFPGL